MATIILNISAEKEAAFKAQAEAHGLTLQEWLLRLAQEQVSSSSEADLQKPNQNGSDDSSSGLKHTIGTHRYSLTKT